MFRKLLPLLSVLLLTARLYSQPGIIIAADFQKGDSVQKVVELLATELKKGFAANYNIRGIASYGCDGLLLLTTEQARKYNITLPKEIRSLGPEGIYIKSDKNCATLVGNSALALQEAVYMYLEQLGYRWLIPGEEWNVVPKLGSVFRKMSVLTKPDYEFRTIANGHAYLNSEKLRSDFDNWARANRMGGAFNIWLGHNYEAIVAARAEDFKKHPEYFSEPVAKGTLPAIPKFNVANKNLVKLVTEVAEKDIQRQIASNHTPLFFSMEPSDGGGHCTTPECLAIGGPSDQVFYLANEVAKVIKKYPGAWVGSYAYYQHIVPTKYKLEPNIFVMVTNGFNLSKYTTNELLGMWAKKVSKTGVYEYLSVYENDMDMPGKMLASKPGYLQKTIREFHKNGARVYQGESTMGWISRGLGQYVLSKLVWNVNVDVDSLKKDFFEKAFEQSADPMKKLYAAWEKNPAGIPLENELASWHSLVGEAYQKANSEKIKQRLEQVMVYLHYVVLFTEIQKKRTEENVIKALRYAWRTMERGSFATVPAMVSLGNYSGFGNLAYYSNTTGQPWMDNKTPVTSSEILNDFRTDAKKFKKTEGIITYDKADKFVSLKDVTDIPKTSYPEGPHSMLGTTQYIIEIKKQSADNYFEIISGYSAAPPVANNVFINFYKPTGSPIVVEEETALLKFEQSRKLEKDRFSLAGLKPGFYSVVVGDYAKMFILQFSASINHSLLIMPELPVQTSTVGGYNTFYFYVPPGLKRFTVMKTNMNLVSPAGRDIKMPINTAESVTIEVGPRESGIWRIYNQAGFFYIQGVPPYFGQHPSRMLVPGYLKK